jgi:uncharacterized protein (TIGR02271 family)
MHAIREGMVVRTTDGEKLGKVASVQGDEFIIEKGLLFKHDYRARCDHIIDVRGDEIIYQRVGAEDRERATPGATPIRETPIKEPMKETAGAAPRDEEPRIPLVEEEVEVSKRATERPGARVKKVVVTENKQFTVPVTREEVIVERVPVDEKTAATASTKLQEDEITVPVVEEEVIVSKRPVIKEEVRVRKQEVQEQRVASAEVRHEEVQVEEVRQPASTGGDMTGGYSAPGRGGDNVKK